jgi:hypothetical protein
VFGGEDLAEERIVHHSGVFHLGKDDILTSLRLIFSCLEGVPVLEGEDHAQRPNSWT